MSIYFQNRAQPSIFASSFTSGQILSHTSTDNQSAKSGAMSTPNVNVDISSSVISSAIDTSNNGLPREDTLPKFLKPGKFANNFRTIAQ